MTGVALRVDLTGLKAVQARLDRLASIDRRQLLQNIGSVVESQTRRRIESEKQSPEGQPWPKWSDRYAETRGSGKSLLRGDSQSGLLDSIDHQVNGDEVEIGSNLVYAATHQFGDRERGIPARPYLGLSGANAAELEEILISTLQEPIS